MARYAISEEGIAALEQLALDLKQSANDIDRACKRLYSVVEGNEEDLGKYYGGIIYLLRQVLQINKEGRECIEQLAGVDIPDAIQRVEELIAMFAEMDDSSGEAAPQKIKRR